MEKLKNTRILAAIGIAGLLLGVIIPYYNIKVLGYSRSIALFGYLEVKLKMLIKNFQ